MLVKAKGLKLAKEHAWTVHVTNFVGNYDSQQQAIVFVDSGCFISVAGGSNIRQAH